MSSRDRFAPRWIVVTLALLPQRASTYPNKCQSLLSTISCFLEWLLATGHGTGLFFYSSWNNFATLVRSNWRIYCLVRMEPLTTTVQGCTKVHDLSERIALKNISVRPRSAWPDCPIDRKSTRLNSS